jgi:DNA-binding transcriptional MerR regulator
MTMTNAGSKAFEAYRTISEVSEEIGVPHHVLRFWEAKFKELKPLKRAGNRRYYRPEDISLLHAINRLLYAEGYTIRGVQKLLREQGSLLVRDSAKAEPSLQTPSLQPAAAAPDHSVVNLPTSDALLPQLKALCAQLAQALSAARV